MRRSVGPASRWVSLCMRGRMIYFDRRVYTQCALITKIFVADRLETPVAVSDNGHVFVEAVIISIAIYPISPLLAKIDELRNKSCPCRYSDYSFKFLAWCWEYFENIVNLIWTKYRLIWILSLESNNTIAALLMATQFLFLNSVASSHSRLLSSSRQAYLSYDLGTDFANCWTKKEILIVFSARIDKSSKRRWPRSLGLRTIPDHAVDVKYRHVLL